MDDIMLIAKSKEMETLIQMNVGMEFGIKKCAILTMKRVGGINDEGIKLPNQKRIRTLEEKENKYVGILEADTIK